MSRTSPLSRRQLVTVERAAEYADCAPRTIRRYVAAGLIPGYRMGPRLVRVDLAELDAMLRPIPAGGEPHGDTAA